MKAFEHNLVKHLVLDALAVRRATLGRATEVLHPTRHLSGF